MWDVFSCVMLCVSLVSASCPRDCRCPPAPPRCAAGVGLTPGGCGCCEACSRQLFDDCSETRPCDRTKGLECNFGGGKSSAKGICRAKSDGRTCEYSNNIYQNGEIFRPSCGHQCACLDGAVGCVALCPRRLALSKPGCAEAGRVKARGRCCGHLVCLEGAKTDSSAGRKQRRTHGEEKDAANGNELAPAWRGGSNSLPDFMGHPTGHMLVGGVKCVSQTTAWSPCSKSCGPGVSTRATSSNAQCKLGKETRICEVRPCKMAETKLKKGQKCRHTEEAARRVKLTHGGCRSLSALRPRYCGSCSDGRCCRPHRTRTAAVRFRCRRGEMSRRMVMVILSCKCDLSCTSSTGRTPDFIVMSTH